MDRRLILILLVIVGFGCTSRIRYRPVKEYMPEPFMFPTSTKLQRTLLRNWQFTFSIPGIVDSSYVLYSGKLLGPDGVRQILPPLSVGGTYWYNQIRSPAAMFGVLVQQGHSIWIPIIQRNWQKFLALQYPSLRQKTYVSLRQAMPYPFLNPRYLIGWFPHPGQPSLALTRRAVVRDHPELSQSDLLLVSPRRIQRIPIAVEPTVLSPGIWQGDSGYFLSTRTPMNGLSDGGMVDLYRVYVLFLDRWGAVRWKRGYPGSYAMTSVIPVNDGYLVSVIPTYLTDFPFLYLEWLDPVEGKIRRHLRVPGRFTHPVPVKDTLWTIKMIPEKHAFVPGWLDLEGNFHPVGPVFTLLDHCPPDRWNPFVAGGIHILEMDGDGRWELVAAFEAVCFQDIDPDFTRGNRIAYQLVLLDLPSGESQKIYPVRNNFTANLFSLQLDRDPLPELVLFENASSSMVRVFLLEYVPAGSPRS